MHLPLPPLPALPPARWLLRPAEWIPVPILEVVVAHAAQQLLNESIQDGSLEFMEGRVLAVQVSDPDLRLLLTLERGWLRGAEGGEPQVTISAAARDLLLLIAGRTDPDTLFFQRRLRLSGDTEFGLGVKNVLDTIDREAIPAPFRAVLGRLADALEPDPGPRAG